MFTSEQEMSILFESYLKAKFGKSYIKEYQGLAGIPDFVFYSYMQDTISIISFELKLKNWKRATQQAFRYKSFSNISYVVMSDKGIKSAIRNIDIFQKYNIGLAIFNKENKFEVIYKPNFGIPYSENLNQKLLDSISTYKNKKNNNRNKDKVNNEKCPQHTICDNCGLLW